VADRPKKGTPWQLWPQGDPAETYEPGLGWRALRPYEGHVNSAGKFEVYDPLVRYWVVHRIAGPPQGTGPVVEVRGRLGGQMPQDLL
jgi:hypothetical protein